ncbi:MAG TPA: hypothetical protein ENH55_10935 [Aurantimonas coralicida]|uniref:Uncharacterized protein n=1 Tax=Aurantimonas coralicida TaxID=182270 RepID=A0A9C9NDP9_9HYPH|nr:hypothetical protein [Aurantimonas coralicida]HET99428.1 hypothetical protein [Aurantimonas coralicida]
MPAIWPTVGRKMAKVLRYKGFMKMNGFHRGHSVAGVGTMAELWQWLRVK